MARPDQHPRLQSMGPGEDTCDVCMYELFPLAPDSICNDCGLNPINDDESFGKFLKESLERELGLPIDDMNIRNMLGDLRAKE